MKDLLKLIDSKCPNAIPLFLVIRGSHAYGTNIETSDIDYAGVFCQSEDDILGMSYVEQINDDKNDTVIYEIRRFLELLAKKSNPTTLEILNTPSDCILYKHPAFDEILKDKDIFITKGCMYSFGGYAREQISKAKGKDKKQNWEKNRISRKTPFDFCYLIVDPMRHNKKLYGIGSENMIKTIPLDSFLSSSGIDQKYCGLSKVSLGRDIYALFHDFKGEELKSSKLGFRGISFEDSNDIRLSSIPKYISDSSFLGYISYNKDGYVKHCRDYKSYQTWLVEKNDQRWVDVKSHDQKIDGKNMLHCVRILNMAKEIASGMGVNVRRIDDVDYLLSIRRGEIDLQTIIDESERKVKECDDLFINSTLPNKIDIYHVNDILVKIRKSVYK